MELPIVIERKPSFLKILPGIIFWIFTVGMDFLPLYIGSVEEFLNGFWVITMVFCLVGCVPLIITLRRNYHYRVVIDEDQVSFLTQGY